MSKIFETIKADYLEARLTSNTIAKNVLSPLIGDLNNLKFVEGFIGFTDEDVIRKVKAYLNGIDTFKLQAPSEVERLEQEAEILRKYVPTQMSEEVIKAKIEDCWNVGMTDMKRIQQFFKENFAGTYDGKLVSTVFNVVKQSKVVL